MKTSQRPVLKLLSTSPYPICRRLVEFASRMSEVRDPASQQEMGRALTEMRVAVDAIANGVVERPEVSAHESAIENLCWIVTTLLRAGHGLNAEDLGNVRAAVEDLMAGVDALPRTLTGSD